MKARFKHAFFPFVLLVVVGLGGCTQNDIFNDETSLGSRQISGTVLLADGSSPAGAYVWLSGFDVGTYTDANGKFQLTLPVPSQQGGVSGRSGVFTVYFYLGNYWLDSAQVVTRDGAFVYEKGDVNKQGELYAPKRLQRFLHIATSVQPLTASTLGAESTIVYVTLRAEPNAVTVIFPNVCPDRDCPAHRVGAVFLRNQTSREVFVMQMSPGAQSRHVVTVGQAPVVRSMAFSLNGVAIPPGRYEVIPYLWVTYLKLPTGLVESLGPDVLALSPEYLKMPFVRESAWLEVKN